jgi:drug/metabolite transporter (DMT)-like permease
MDALVVATVGDVSVAAIGTFRYAVQASAVLIVIRIYTGRFKPVRRTGLRLHVLRGGLMVASTMTFWVALANIPLAEAVALGSLSPVVAAVLAIPLVGERPRALQWAAVALGTVGAILVVQPGLPSFVPASLLAASTAFFYGLLEVVTRRIGSSEPATTTLVYTGVIGLAAMVVGLAVTGGATIAPTVVPALAAISIAGLAGHALLIGALQRAPVPAVSPVSYTGLIWSTIYGAIFFGQYPNALAAVGMAVIGFAGLLLVMERLPLGSRGPETPSPGLVP